MVEPVPRLYPSCAQCFPGLPGLADSAVLLTPWPGSCSWHSLSFNPVACGLGLDGGSCVSAAIWEQQGSRRSSLVCLGVSRTGSLECVLRRLCPSLRVAPGNGNGFGQCLEDPALPLWERRCFVIEDRALNQAA